MTAGGRVPGGVGDQVPEDLLEPTGIGVDQAVRRREIEAGEEAGLPEEFVAIFDALSQDRVCVDELRAQCSLPSDIKL